VPLEADDNRSAVAAGQSPAPKSPFKSPSAIALPADQSLDFQSVLAIHHAIPSFEHRYAIHLRDQHFRQIYRDHIARPQAEQLAHCHFGLGKLYGKTNKGEQARDHLTSAITLYREMGMSFWLEKAEAELGGVER
jgi:hypothetical protein